MEGTHEVGRRPFMPASTLSGRSVALLRGNLDDCTSEGRLISHGNCTRIQFLQHLHHKSLRSARRAVVILDNAKYHHALLHKAWREEVKARFRLDFLPPYSPELNPIERVWKLTRRLCLHNVYFPKLDQVCINAEQQFDQWSTGSNALKKLCAIT